MQELLIEKVRQYEFLYNVHSVQYRDQNMRHEAWEEIGRELKITATEARDMWSKLRNCYSNALRRRNSKKSGQGAKKIVPWKFEQQMAFLQPYLDGRATQSNMSQSEDPQLSDEHLDVMENVENDIVDEDTRELDRSSSVSSPSTSTGVRSNPPSRRRKIMNPAEEMVQILKKNSEMRIQKSENKIENHINKTDMFFLSMSKTVQQLPQLEQVRIRMEIFNLVSQAEMRQIQHQTQATTNIQMQTQYEAYASETDLSLPEQSQSLLTTYDQYDKEVHLTSCSASAWR